MQMSQYRSVLLIDKIHSPSDMLSVDIDFEKFYKMSKESLTSGKFEWFISGNLTKEQALQIAEESEKVFENMWKEKFELITHSSDLVHIRPLNIDKNTTLNYVIDSKDKDNQNSCVFSYFQHNEETLKLKILSEVVFQYLGEPTFNQLRTKEQLGYIASSFNVPIRLIWGGGFIIQSTIGSPEFLISRINSFLDTHKEEVKNVSDDYFQKIISSVVERKKQKDLNLREETTRLGYEIFSHQFEFDRKNKEIELLKQLEKGEFIHYFYDLFYNEPRRMNIQLLAQQHNENQKEFKAINQEYYTKNGISNMYIDSISKFKSEAKFYPDLYKITEKLKAKI